MDPKRLIMLCGNLAGMIFEDEGRDDDGQEELGATIHAAITEWLSANPAPDEDEDDDGLDEDDE